MAFQSTRPVRARLALFWRLAPLFKFQSTRPVRARPATGCTSSAAGSHFNPRAPCGRDVKEGDGYYTYYNSISIHAPRAGATFFVLLLAYLVRFQSTRPVRARHRPEVILILETAFQSTRPVRARLCVS